MAEYTENLKLFKYDPITDAKQVFSISDALNYNWDILDKNGAGGWNLFDTKITDHVLTGDEAIGWVLQGSLVTNTYPDAVSRIKQEYNEGTNETYLETTDIVLPTFTANTTNGITVSDARSSSTAWNLINGQTSRQIGAWNTYWFNINYAQPVILTQYSIKADSNGNPEYPTDWTLQASNDGEIWQIINTQTEQVFTLGQERNFSIDNETAYNQYRLVFSNGLTASGGGELGKLSFSAYKIDLQFNYKKHSNGHKIADILQQSELDKYYNKYGMCNFYILDSANNQFYLPKSKYTYQITDDINKVFDKQDAGLPNIVGGVKVGGIGSQPIALQNGSGAFKLTESGRYMTRSENGGNAPSRFELDASLCNSIYGNSQTVQPPGILYLLYYKVGNTVTNDSQIDIGNVLSDLNVIENQKADKDLSNCTKPYIVEEIIDGYNWIRKWSNGTLEQGGYSSQSNVTITLNISYKDPNYLVFTGKRNLDNSGANSRILAVYNITSTNFYVTGNYNNGTGTDAPFFWWCTGQV